jgi:hypothetical protein
MDKTPAADEPVSEVEHLDKLLAEERKLSEFRRERWENAEARLEHVWNQAIEAARAKLGQHTPPCDSMAAMPCWLCWQNAKLTSLLRLDGSGYKTIHERLKEQADFLGYADRDCSLEYLRGIGRMFTAAKSLFGERE